MAGSPFQTHCILRQPLEFENSPDTQALPSLWPAGFTPEHRMRLAFQLFYSLARIFFGSANKPPGNFVELKCQESGINNYLTKD